MQLAAAIAAGLAALAGIAAFLLAPGTDASQAAGSERAPDAPRGRPQQG